jgi:DNA-binding ferritin-like protein
MDYTRAELLSGLLSILWFLRIQHQQVHWLSKGPNYYGDHLLFARLYEAVDGELDQLAEKIIGLDGPVPPMHGPQGALLVAAQFAKFEEIEDLAMRATMSEKMFLSSLKKVYDCLEERGELTMGLDDLLQAFANTHETHLYLLQQRVEMIPGGKL